MGNAEVLVQIAAVRSHQVTVLSSLLVMTNHKIQLVVSGVTSNTAPPLQKTPYGPLLRPRFFYKVVFVVVFIAFLSFVF